MERYNGGISYTYAGVAALAFGLAAFGLQAEARAAPCMVTDAADNAGISNTLRWCVERVNHGFFTEIDIALSATYALDTPLEFYESARVTTVPGVTIVHRLHAGRRRGGDLSGRVAARRV